MSRPRVGVSADAFVAVVRAYADRVHDDVRRLGCTAAEAAEVVETSALGLAERLRVRPHEVRDLVGAWFRDARVYADRVGSGVDADDLAAGEGIVQRSEDDAAARGALIRLNDRDRVALLLRDAYDLPYVSAGVALGLDQDATATVVARARLRFLRLVGDGPDDPAEHDPELAAAARLADGQLAPDLVPATERHVAKCPVCGPVVPAMREARRLLSGLAILAMADAERDRLITRATAVAERVLPSAAEVAAAEDAPEPSDLPRWWMTAACLTGAFVLGAVLALAGDGASLSSRSGGPPSFEPGVPTRTASPSSLTPTPTPTATATATASATASRTAPPSRTASPTPSPTFEWFVGGENISLSPASGPNESTVTVTGTGWRPGQAVTIQYLNALGGATGQQATGVPDASGRFIAHLVCADPANIPGPHTVRARNNSGQTDSATFNAGA
jgi:hypothetical protein